MARSSRDSITTRIALQGGEEVKRQLEQLGAAGERALRQIDNTARLSNSNLARISSVAATAFSGFRAAGDALRPVRDSFADLGAKVGAFGNAVRGAVPQLGLLTGSLGLGAAAFGAFALAKKAALATDELVDTAENLGATTEEILAFRQLAVAAGGDADTFVKALGKMNVATAEAALKAKGATVELKDQVTTLRGNASAAERAAAGIEVLRGAEKGLKSEVAGGLTVLRGAGEALAGNAGTMETIAKILGTTTTELNRMKLVDRFLAIGKAIAQVKDETVQNKLANDLFGRSWREVAPAMREAETQLLPMIKNIKELGLGVSSAEKAMSEGFLAALGAAGVSWSALFRTIGNLIGTVAAPAVQAFSALINQNIAAIRVWAAAVGKEAVPAVQELITMLQNLARDPAAQQPLKTQWAKDLAATAESVRQVIGLLAGAFRGLVAAIDVVLRPINQIFGTQLTGGVVLATALILQFLGVFSLLGLAVSAFVTGPIALLTAALGPAGLLFAGIAAVGGALLVMNDNWKNIIGTAGALGDLLVALAGYLEREFVKIWTAATTAIRDAWSGAMTWISEKIAGVLSFLERLIAKAQAAARALAGVFGAAGSAPGTVPVPGFATGGRVPGSGTGDIVPALLEPGEFVIRRSIVGSFGAEFFERLNQGLLPAPRGFATGGLVGAGAGGGSSAAPVHLHLDGKSFPLRGDQDVVDALGKQARARKLRSAGRAPGFVG